MDEDPLLTTLLDLDAALESSIQLIVGGGYGLYLKQLYLKDNSGIRTLFPVDRPRWSHPGHVTILGKIFVFVCLAQ